MSISVNDKIFKFYKKRERGNTERFAYYGWEGMGQLGFYNYSIGFKNAGDAIYDAFYSAAKDHRIDVQDTIVFPLCFNYRHATELFIKYLFVKYSNPTEDELRIFFDNNHKIIDAWKATRPSEEL